MPIAWLILKILGIWTLISISCAFLFGGLLNLNSGRCFFHGAHRRLVITTEAWEYYECPVCGAREAEKLYGLAGEYPINYDWLKGKSWLG